MKKLEKPIELKDRLIKYESVAHLDKADGKKTVKAKAPIMKKIKKMSGGAPRLLVISYLKSNESTIMQKLFNKNKFDESSFKVLGENSNVRINEQISEIYESVNLDDIRSELLGKYNKLESDNIYFKYLNITDEFDVYSFMKEFTSNCEWIFFPKNEYYNEFKEYRF